ncbi:hypothetical protein IFR05_007041 [Cadophora sp. M221]|nr:hypothetical protein IFR05_007041 [Cadophora sp. M221]
MPSFVETCVITGANTGLGLDCAKHMCFFLNTKSDRSLLPAKPNHRANFRTAKIILTCRDLEKGSATNNTILKLTPQATINSWALFE